ncbi:hypothetical protein BRADI_2g23955v3 [Brachypodium distachyon]|uniref:Uncharacterized protein n=1 Tax=Brachypodium distachyon TaxID=15368 RepID=A0A2K2DA79_BRADI|nr:hypothetical protein BRADI_2g23955v3 [Brachypodium distachyon]
MAGSTEAASSEERPTIFEPCRSSSSSSSSSEDDELSEPMAGIAKSQEQRHQQQVKEAWRLNDGGELMSMMMVAGGFAVAVAAAFIANKKC